MGEPNPLLVEQARIALSRAVNPYSGYHVGVALLVMRSGDPEAAVFLGTNIENASYGLTICAERVAMFAAIAQGYTYFLEMVCMTRDGGSSCGACRQIAHQLGHDMTMYFTTQEGEVVLQANPDQLLPHAFSLKEK